MCYPVHFEMGEEKTAEYDYKSKHRAFPINDEKLI